MNMNRKSCAKNTFKMTKILPKDDEIHVQMYMKAYIFITLMHIAKSLVCTYAAVNLVWRG